MIRKAAVCILTVMAAAAAVGALCYLLWNNGAFLPRWIVWESRELCDRSGAYEISLEHKTVRVVYEDSVIWTSPDGVKVQQALSCDIDNDHQDELILLCWKIGRYGSRKPFWVEKDEKKWSQHIFVYEYNRSEIQPKWMSSYIGQDVVNMAENGKDAPFTRLWLTDSDQQVSSWFWDSWGFTKENTDISFVAFGDLLAHEPIYRYGLLQDETFSFLFENFREIIAESDIAVINQETPLTDNPAAYSDYPRFGTPVNIGQAIAAADFDAVTCATNHALDQGADGVSFTKHFFDSNHVTCLGIQSEEETDDKPYEILTRKGVRFALLNYTYGTNGIPIPSENPSMVHLLEDESKIRNDIEKAGLDADFVIVFVHWGTEYSSQIDASQQKWTQVFLESKADVVIGTHPHVLQPYEMLTDDTGHQMLVYYSIGNFISAQPEKSCIKGGMARFTISLTPSGYQISEYSLQPLEITWQGKGKYMVDYVG
ncbi:MAG: CapA family protein [Lachnospiraceae bacterium]|nr:CapA family protein [Lachnospiraceae bacterium]